MNEIDTYRFKPFNPSDTAEIKIPNKIRKADKSMLCLEMVRKNWCSFQMKFGVECPYAHSVAEA